MLRVSISISKKKKKTKTVIRMIRRLSERIRYCTRLCEVRLLLCNNILFIRKTHVEMQRRDAC